MVKINEIARTSTFAWSSDSLPLLATGTVAGAVDVNFSSSASLEVWDTFSATNKDEPIFSASVDNRFYALAWSKPFEGRPKGLIAGAFENGVVEFWDAEVLIKSKSLEKSSVHKSTKHTGPVRSLAFNPLQDHVLVSGGSNGQIFIWDTKKFSEPFSPGQAMTPMDEVSSVAWNNSVSHILASTGGNGYTSVWDLKSKREVLHLSYSGPSGRANFSHVAWHPTQSTKLITASDSDSCPLILTWDLRNSNEPEIILDGHKKGVLSLDWCKQDPELLISSGKDNTTFLWNPVKGTKLGEYPTTANWAFQTKFAPAAPEIFATASFDGKIVVQSLQDTSPPVSAKVASTDDSVFWNQISTTETQQPVFQVNQAPKWLKRPVSVSFGFGSKIVTVKDQDGKSTVHISKLMIKGQDSKFDALKTGDYKSIIDSKLEKVSNANDKSDWELLKKLSEGKADIIKEITNEKAEKEQKEEKEDELKEKEEKEVNDDFFDKLGNGNHPSTEDVVEFSGSFNLIDSDDSENKVIELILNNKIEDAVELCLDQDKLVEALILSLDSSDSIKQKVRNVYFKKNDKSQFSRVVHDISTNNIADIVSNASVSNWKEIASSIVAFSSDPQDLHHRISELGDRILKSDDKDSRTNAITCYLAGNALDKIANIWLKELPDFELELLKSNNVDITSPAEARLEALTNFVSKIVTYRTITNETGVLSGPSVEAISKAILEYANLVAGYGEFDLAEKFLKLLPGEYAGSEKDRISKALGKGTTAKAQTKNYSRPNEKVNLASLGSTGVSHSPSAAPGISTPGIPTPGLPTPGFPAAAKPFANGSPAAPGFPPAPGAGFQPAAQPSSNPYARAAGSNPYAPQASNIYKPAQPTQPTPSGVISPPPIAPTKSYKKDTEGWNDLPDTFKPKAAPRRAAPAAVVAAQPAAPFSPGPQVAPGPPKRPGSTASVPLSSVVPPPPKIGGRTASGISTPSAPQSPRQAPVHLNNRYAPPPGSAEAAPVPPPLSSNPSFGAPSATAPPKKNPYAPAEGANSSPARVAYAPPPVGNVVPPNGIGSPSVGRSSISAPPKNPYAPPAGNFGRGGSLNPSAATPPPPPQSFGAPPVNNFAPPPSYGASTPPVQPPFTSIPPPPRAPSIGQQPPAAPPAGPPVSAPSQSASQSASQPAQPAKPQYPAGDRSHIPEKSLPIYETFTEILTAIKPVIPEKFARHGQDMETRLNYLFDHLNNDDLLSDETIESLKSICSSLKARDFPTAAKLNVEVATKHADELGNWHTGVKRLITMSEAMY